MNPHLIQGGRNVHERGSVSFVNGFDFNGVGSGRSHRLLHGNQPKVTRTKVLTTDGSDEHG